MRRNRGRRGLRVDPFSQRCVIAFETNATRLVARRPDDGDTI